MKRYLLLFLVVTLLYGSYRFEANANDRSQYMAVPGLIDLRTNFSDGDHSIKELAEIARLRGFKVIFVNDHERIALAYGVPPFRHLLRYKKEFQSVSTHGPDKFLEEIESVSNIYTDMVIIPGCETSPYYYWSGSYFKGTLTAHGYDKRILILNFDDPQDYEGLPSLGNNVSFRYTLRRLPGLGVFVVPLILGFVLLKWKGLCRIAGVCIIIFSVIAILDYNPFRGTLYDQYDGDKGILPHQEVLDYVQERKALSFWNYPEQRSGTRKHGPISVDTPPYPEVLFQAANYNGFSAIYGDKITITEPGKLWDMLLRAYCAGKREKPVWGISTADFHGDGKLGQLLGAYPTTFLVREFSKKEILRAMENGRMYCSFGDGNVWPKLDYFNILGNADKIAYMGDTLITKNPPVIKFRVSYDEFKPRKMNLLLIRDGAVIQNYEGSTPIEAEFVDKTAPNHRKTFYRIMDAKKHLVSNPIFIKYNAH